MNIIEEFVKKGILVSPELKDKINPEKINEIISKFDKNKIFLTEKEYNIISSSGVKILNEYKRGSEIKKISNFVDFYNKRFEFLRSILEEKIGSGITSINKLNYGEVSVIGMVRDVKDNGFLLEDLTGSVFCLSDEKVIEDDVIGVKGNFDKSNIHVNKVVYPDIPLNRKVNLSENNCYVYFTHNFTEKPSRALYVITFNVSANNIDSDFFLVSKKTDIPKSPRRIFLNLPSLIEIEGIKIFIFEPDFEAIKKRMKENDEKKIIINLIKRRHFLPNVFMENDPYLIKEIPDIVFIRGSERFFLNYKGISIISVTGDKGFLVNLKTREYEEI